ncbi:hypothetical protein A0H76_2619 [Hepatospora eriocheir]|uniref:Uncharacterized protein n=1 Tax=Hepatospora eriocheir TaxID=1081669 RepID=A0A1X0QJK0_9MICR|nr:hypothetical protein A0H76_2619 [Hepatospora eriocheir]
MSFPIVDSLCSNFSILDKSTFSFLEFLNSKIFNFPIFSIHSLIFFPFKKIAIEAISSDLNINFIQILFLYFKT